MRSISMSSSRPAFTSPLQQLAPCCDSSQRAFNSTRPRTAKRRGALWREEGRGRGEGGQEESAVLKGMEGRDMKRRANRGKSNISGGRKGGRKGSKQGDNRK